MRALAVVVAVGVLVVPIRELDAQDTPSQEEKKPEGTGEVKSVREDAQRSDRQPTLSDVDVANAQGLSTGEKQGRAEKMLGDMRDALRRVTEILGEARGSKDIVQLNCVNEKLTQIKGLLRISEDASVKMYDAIASGAQDVINHEFTKISVAHQKTTILRAEAEQCVGERSVYTGETTVDVEIDPDITDTDPTTPDDFVVGPEVPPVASGF